MKTLLLILTLFVATATAQDVYKFDSDAEFKSVAVASGFAEPTITSEMILRDTVEGINLEAHYIGRIITNYPVTDSTWVADTSTSVYILSVKSKNVKPPANYKTKGNERKYIWKYIAKYYGEQDTY